MEHIVSRADVAGAESSPSPSPEPDILERFRELGEFDFVTPKTPGDCDEAANDDGDDGLQFQLFAAPKAGGNLKAEQAGEAPKIRLRSPSLDPERVGFVRPHRNQNYYFTRPATAVEKQQFKLAALTSDQVISLANSPRPGSAYAWKVLHLPPSGLAKDLRSLPPSFAGVVGDAESKKRTRPGKKYRNKLRNKSAAKQAQKDAKKAAGEAKEAAEREKRTRRNREKKVKKKAKEKAKKEGKGGDEDVRGEHDAPAD